MEQGIPNRRPRHRRYFFDTFWGTALWVVPTMAVLLVGGYLLAKDYVGPTYLQPSAVTVDRPQPIRILSPKEAQAVARDEPSHVWTEGVQPSDIPKMETDQPKHSWKPAPGKKPDAPAATKPAAPSAGPSAPAKPDTPQPATGNTPPATPDSGADGDTGGDNVSPD